LVFGGGLFLAVDTDLDVWTSADATNWSHHGSTTGVRPACVGWGHDEFVICSNPTLEYFQNGSWIPAPTNIYAAGIAFGNGTFAAGTRLYQSDPVIKFQMLATGTFHLLGPPGAYTIETAGNLATPMPWQTYTNLFVTESPLHWVDPRTSNAPIRFYRAGFAP
jgi:hypothetical protein